VPPTLTPAAWLERLEKRLDDRWFRVMGRCDAYFEGDHNIAYATAQWREAFGALLGPAIDNWCPLIVESSTERMEVQGFRFGKSTSADAAAWDIWQANGLDSWSDVAHTEAVKLGEAYWLIEPPARNSSDPPRITFETPMQMIVATAPGNPRQRVAALKKWVDEDEFAYANVYLPGQVAKYRSQEKARDGRRIQWVRRQDDPGGSNPLGEVPVVPLLNAPDRFARGSSDLKVAFPIQDALNKLLCDMLLTSEYLAFPQRVLLGIEVPKDPVTGQPISSAQLQAARSRLWAFEPARDSSGNQLPGIQPKIDQFDAVDLANYVNARQHLVRALTAKTRTPPHYILGEIVNASGDALTAAEAGLTSKVRKKLRFVGEGHEDAMRLAFKAMGDTAKAAVTSAETIWRDPERVTLAQLADAAQKQKDIGVPWEILMEFLGYGPTEIGRMQTMQLAQSLFGPIGAPAPTNVRVQEAVKGGQVSQTPPPAGPTPAGP
jgi:hypothetical protein